MEEFKASQESRIRYLKRRIEEMTVLMQSSPLDLELAKKMGHQIKGNAESFDFSDIAMMGKVLDKAAIMGQEQEVRKCVADILTALQAHLEKNAAPL
jgi:HPt (histidine-containing phosphotransfer) domain-containing protein